jgi:hypothetical protein
MKSFSAFRGLSTDNSNDGVYLWPNAEKLAAPAILNCSAWHVELLLNCGCAPLVQANTWLSNAHHPLENTKAIHYPGNRDLEAKPDVLQAEKIFGVDNASGSSIVESKRFQKFICQVT